MATRKKSVESESEENNEEVLETKEVKEIPEEKVLEVPNIEPIVREEIPVLRDEEPAEEDPKTFDDVYALLEQIDGKLDVIIRGL